MKPDREKLRTLLSDTVTLLCRNTFEWNFQSHMCVQGVVGVTLDDKEVLLVHINRKVKSGCSADTTSTSNKLDDISEAQNCVEMMSGDLDRLNTLPIRKRKSGIDLNKKPCKKRMSRRTSLSSGDSDHNATPFSTPQKVHSTNGLGNNEEQRKIKENHLLKVVLPAVEKLKAKGNVDDSDCCSEGSNNAATACSTSSIEDRSDRRKSKKPLNINVRRAKFEPFEGGDNEEESVYTENEKKIAKTNNKTFEAGVWEQSSLLTRVLDDDSNDPDDIASEHDEMMSKDDTQIDKDDQNFWMPGKKVRRSALSKSKPHKCEIRGCDKSFYHKTHLRRHERLSHNMLPARMRHLSQSTVNSSSSNNNNNNNNNNNGSTTQPTILHHSAPLLPSFAVVPSQQGSNSHSLLSVIQQRPDA